MLDDASVLMLSMEVEVQKLSVTSKLTAWLNWAYSSTVEAKGDFQPSTKRAAAMYIACALSPDSVNNMLLGECMDALSNLIERTEPSDELGKVLEKFGTLGSNRFRPQKKIIYLSQELVIIINQLGIFNFIDSKTLTIQFQMLENQALEVETVQTEESYKVLRGFADQVLQVWAEGLGLQREWEQLLRTEIELSDYLYANEMVIACKEIAVKISPKTWEVVLERMLLPIAEIEKRKREKGG
jgi:hypothetical protein